MSGLGDVLEVIFAKRDTAVDVHAVVRERRDGEVAQRTAERFVKSLPRQSLPLMVKVMMVPALAASAWWWLGDRVRREPDQPVPPGESELTVWLDASGRARVERSWPTTGGTERLIGVVQTGGPADWPRGPMVEPGWRREPGRAGRWPTPSAADVERLFSHQQLREVIACLTLETLREDEAAGRPVLVVRAMRRKPLGLWPHWLPFGADDYELAFDREHGHLLGFQAHAGGAVYADIAVTEITYGAPIDQRLLDMP